MAFVNMTFNLAKSGKSAYESTMEYNEYFENLKLKADRGESVTSREVAKLDRLENRAQRTRKQFAKSAVSDALAVSQFAYNYTAATTRFGLRGQDIHDQLKIQDKMVNKAFGVASSVVTGAAIGGAPGAIATGIISLLETITSEIISVNVQNKQYEYNRQIDEQQKSITRERVGRALYNSSRR